jgi:hypothetical protein
MNAQYARVVSRSVAHYDMHARTHVTEAAETAAERSRIVWGAYRHVSGFGGQIDDDHEASLVELSSIQVLICVRLVLDEKFDKVREEQCPSSCHYVSAFGAYVPARRACLPVPWKTLVCPAM